MQCWACERGRSTVFGAQHLGLITICVFLRKSASQPNISSAEEKKGRGWGLLMAAQPGFLGGFARIHRLMLVKMLHELVKADDVTPGAQEQQKLVDTLVS